MRAVSAGGPGRACAGARCQRGPRRAPRSRRSAGAPSWPHGGPRHPLRHAPRRILRRQGPGCLALRACRMARARASRSRVPGLAAAGVPNPPPGAFARQPASSPSPEVGGPKAAAAAAGCAAAGRVGDRSLQVTKKVVLKLTCTECRSSSQADAPFRLPLPSATPPPPPRPPRSRTPGRPSRALDLP